MTTKATGATVVRIDSHPAWQAAQRRSHDLAEAMRRHPAFQSRMLPTPDPVPATRDAAVYRFGAR